MLVEVGEMLGGSLGDRRHRLVGRAGDDGHDPAVDVTREMLAEEADGSRLTRHDDTLGPVTVD
jgi:hypothetical protein